jgi:hypothetical protein
MYKPTNLQNTYDEICGIAYINVHTLSKDKDAVVISPFNPRNKEHLFVLNIAKGVAGVNHKEIIVDTDRFHLWMLNRGLDKDCRYKKMTDNQSTMAIDPDGVLGYMRHWAGSFTGEARFDFGQIYDEFYAKKGKKQ